MAATERYTRTTNGQGLQVIARRDGRPLGAAPPRRDPQLDDALDLIRRAAEAVRESARRRGLRTPLTPPMSHRRLPPELAGIGGPAVRRAREAAGLGQRDLAPLVGYSRSAVAEMERGRRSVPERVARWAHGVLVAGTAEGSTG